MKNGTLSGSRYTEATREALRKERIDESKQTFSSTGFNSIKIPVQDATLHAISRRYGKETQMDTAPNYKPNGWTTNFRSTFHSPTTENKGNWRTREAGQIFDYDSQTLTKTPAYNSGFTQNSMICDGKLFVTEKTMHTDIIRTAYRNQFN